jgi:hypothetical protein
MREREEEWKELCRQAAVEQDSTKLMELTRRINEMLIHKQHRIDEAKEPPKPDK